jgi:hypothetical protein
MLEVVDDARMLAGDGHAAWSESFNELFMQVAGCFANTRVRRHGRAYLLGLLSGAERKNSWQLAEFAGDASPDGMQRLLNFSPRTWPLIRRPERGRQAPAGFMSAACPWHRDAAGLVSRRLGWVCRLCRCRKSVASAA